MNTKTWVPGFEGCYEINLEAEVFSAARVIKSLINDKYNRELSSRKLDIHVDKQGYHYVVLSVGNRAKSFRVHRLMMLTFSPSVDADVLDVNHKDGDKLNNTLSNLEWCTRSENIKHAYRVLGRAKPHAGKFGVLHHRSMAVIATGIEGESKKFDSLMSAQRDGFSAGHISACLAGKRKFHKGFTWSLA